MPDDAPLPDDLLLDLHRRGLRELDLYHRLGSIPALHRALTLFRQVVDGMTASTPGRDVHLRNLAHACVELYDHTRDLPLLHEGIALFRRAIAAAPARHPYIPAYQYGLGRALLRLYAGSGDRRHLDESAELQRRALTHPLADPGERAAQLAGLAETLEELYRATGDSSHLHEAIALQRQAATVTPPGTPEARNRLVNLATLLIGRYEAEYDPLTLDEAVDVLRTARGGVVADRPAEPWQIPVNLAAALHLRYQLAGRLEDLDEAIALLQRVLDTASPARTPAGAGTAAGPQDPHRPMLIGRIADLLVLRARAGGGPWRIDRATALLHQGLREVPRGHPDHGALLLRLGEAYRVRHDLTDDPADLEQAIAHQRTALGTPGQIPANLSVAMSTLARMLHRRHERTGSADDLDEAIDLLRQALARSPADDPNLTTHRAILAQCLEARFHVHGDLTDLDRGDEHLRQALDALPQGHPQRPFLLAALGSSHLLRYEHTGVRRYLDEAIDLQRSAVAACQDGAPQRYALLGNLALSLRIRYDADADPADADEAVGLLRQILAARRDNPGDQRITLLGLAEALRSRYEHDGSAADLEECAELLRSLVAGYPAGHPFQVQPRSALAEALYRLSLRTGDRELLTEALEAARGAACVDTAPVRSRLHALVVFGQLNGTLSNWDAARRAMSEAVALLPRLAARSLRRTDQQYILASVSGLAAEAAAYALQAGRPDEALKVLEHGRGVLLSRLLRTRESDLARLRRDAPGLAERFVRLREELDSLLLENHPLPGTAADGEHSAERMRAREAEWDALLERIRALPGLGGFLRPPTSEQILQQAGDGPVVIVNAGIRCDAIIVARGAVDVLPLDTTAQEVHSRVEAFLSAVHTFARPAASSFTARLALQEPVYEVLEWLWDTITGPVLERLSLTTPVPAGARPPRIWWCPQGPLSFLPLHAAGYHGPRADPDRPRCALAMAASSYTPTIAALHHARQQPEPADDGGHGPLLVAMSRTPGATPLASAGAEMRKVRECLGTAVQPVELADQEATTERVLQAMRQARSVHLACHAVADPQDPSASRILTYDHKQRPLTVTDVAGLRLTGADLAFLSACATSRTRQELADEAIHITGAFQLAGFRNVVGTLWPVGDEAASQLAETFYRALAQRRHTDDGSSDDAPALALHSAVTALHNRYLWFPTLWASHVHVGA